MVYFARLRPALFRLFCDMGKGSSVVNLKRHHENRVKDGKTHPE